MEHVVKQPGSPRLRLELGVEPDEPTRRNDLVEPDATGSMVNRLLVESPALCHELRDDA